MSLVQFRPLRGGFFRNYDVSIILREEGKMLRTIVRKKLARVWENSNSFLPIFILQGLWLLLKIVLHKSFHKELLPNGVFGTHQTEVVIVIADIFVKNI